MKVIYILTTFCRKKGYVSEDQILWFQYTIEKRLSSLLIFVSLFLIGTYLTSPIVSFSFISSFFYLRQRTNGLHAKTFLGCFLWSIISEVLVLGILFKNLQFWIAILLLSISSIGILLFAPFDHPSMHFTAEEIEACAVSSRKRLLVLGSVMIVCYMLGYEGIFISITLGITMAAVMLVIARITLRRGKDE